MRKWIDLLESTVNWWNQTEQQLREFASQYVGYATNQMGDPNELSWEFDSMFSLDQLAHERDWDEFYQYDVVENPRYGEDFADEDFHTPIVVSIEEGAVILWDGNHRVATAIYRGDRYISAVVGREKIGGA